LNILVTKISDIKVYLPNPIEQNALRLIRDEKSAWEFSNVWVSSDAYFTMRQEIDKARKNYYGQFEEPVDKNTKLEKLWIPLTEWTCERIIASIDLDTKDVQLRHPEGKDIRVPAVMRLIVLNFLRKINFGEFLNDFIRRLVIDGTAITKCFKFWNPEYKRNLPTLRIVDPLNFIIDPTAYSIQDGPIIEKSIMTKDEVERYRGKWKNLDEIKYEGSVPTCMM